MGIQVAKQLISKKLSHIDIINRAYELAQALAEQAGGRAYPWSELSRALASADIVIACGGSEGRDLTADVVRRAQDERNGRALAIIDIAVPRSVESNVSAIGGVELATIDSLKGMAEENLKSRLGEVGAAQAIVDEEVNRYCEGS